MMAAGMFPQLTGIFPCSFYPSKVIPPELPQPRVLAELRWDHQSLGVPSRDSSSPSLSWDPGLGVLGWGQPQGG